MHIPGAELTYSAADKESLVEVYWPNMQTYYQGVIKEFRDVGDEDDAGHSGLKIVYTDGDVRWCLSGGAPGSHPGTAQPSSVSDVHVLSTPLPSTALPCCAGFDAERERVALCCVVVALPGPLWRRCGCGSTTCCST